MIKLNSSSKLTGEIIVPSDKSISHRAAILNSIAIGTSQIFNFSDGDDCLSTLSILSNLGVKIKKSFSPNQLDLTIEGKGLHGLSKPLVPLDAGNSGTTTRLISGILSSASFNSNLSGDKFLNNRPMKRIIDPLLEMGAKIQSDNFKAPLIFSPSKLNGIHYKMKIASAQVKSCILIASLNASSPTTVSQPALSRDHTEKMLESMGAKIEIDNLDIHIQPGPINAINMQVPGDISSAAFWIVAALIHPSGNLTLKNVCVNKTRRGIIDILIKMGGNIKLYNEKIIANEPVCDIDVKHSSLRGVTIEGDLVPFLIDEIPIIIVAAALSKGETIIRDASELRVKETDRLLAMSNFLTISSVKHKLYEDGLKIIGGSELLGGSFKSYDDHRIAMSIAISSIVAKNETIIDDHEVASISYKSFWHHFNYVTGSNV